jgi:SAM-dependent methyltransferase
MKGVKHIFSLEHHNLDAPKEIVPYLLDKFYPQSVVDVGCGTGTFLHVFLKNDIKDILGIDGNWVKRSDLFIPEIFFMEKDLEKELNIKRKFDLVLCLEVAEHLSENAAEALIENLIGLGDIIIFSAAVINQGGQNHINEQHFDYWIEKFDKKGFVFYDIFRKQFWNNRSINWWYKQNMFLVVKDSIDVSKYGITEKKANEIQEYIHPELLALQVKLLQEQRSRIRKILQGEASLKFYTGLLRKKIARHFLKK